MSADAARIETYDPVGLRHLARSSALIAVAFLVAVAALGAAGWALGLGPAAAKALALHFDARAGGLGQSALIWRRNAALAAVAFLAAWMAPRSQPWRTSADTFAIIIIAAQALLAAAALSAYSSTMLRSAARYAPVELAGFCLALATYRQARRQRTTAARLATIATIDALTLAIAALLEAHYGGRT